MVNWFISAKNTKLSQNFRKTSVRNCSLEGIKKAFTSIQNAKAFFCDRKMAVY